MDDILLVGCLSDLKELSDILNTLSDSNGGDKYSVSIQAPYRVDMELIAAESKSDPISPPFLYGQDLERTKLPIQQRPIVSLQNEKGEYFSKEEWNGRNVLKILGDRMGLLSIAEFLRNPLWNSSMNYAYLKAANNIDGILDPNSCDLRVQIERT